MRGYTVATAAVALNVTAKWVDNALSHHRVVGVFQARQGVARRLTVEAVTVLEITLRLMRALRIPAAIALQIGQELSRNGSAYSREGCEVRLDVDALRSTVAQRLAEAVEYTPVPRRGRPFRHR
ncbi:MAG: hypothetical protein ACSLFK_14260 [Gemmatimonadaceae bacterium]